MENNKMKLTEENFKKIGRGALIACGGALLTYLAELIPNVDFGNFTPLAVAIGGILINSARQWLSEK